MQLMDFVRLLEGKSNEERHQCVCDILRDWGVPYQLHLYDTGKNIYYKPETALPHVAIGSHFDVVPFSAGANDNASAIAVALYVLKQSLTHKFDHFSVAFFCFDEEESWLQGSKAYVDAFGVQDLRGIYNLELVGQGDKFALWSLNPTNKGVFLETFEKTAQERGIVSFRFDQIVTNLADHLSFREAGLPAENAFTITCISDQDLAVAGEYYMAQAQNRSLEDLFRILQKAPLFQHYHQPTDLSTHLSETCLQMTAQTLWQTLLNLDK
ncbi:MAG: M28 family peptidase [Bacteroidetes bacterium]|nr:MAG: M28 family peptidase [Bacteroidota bacterium]